MNNFKIFLFFITFSLFSAEMRHAHDAKNIIKSAHAAIITNVKISPDSQFIASSSIDGSIKLWNINTSQLIKEYKTDKPEYVSSISWSPDSTKLAALYRTKKLRILGIGLDNINLLDEQTFEGGVPGMVAWSPNSDEIALNVGKKILIYSYDSAPATLALKSNFNSLGSINSIIWRDANTFIAAGPENENQENSISVWDYFGERLANLPVHASVGDLSFSGKYLAASLANKSIILYDYDNVGDEFKEINKLNVDSNVTSLAWFKKSMFLATGDITGNISIYNTIGNGKIINRYQAHQVPITDIDWSTDGKFIVSGSSDKTITIWKNPLKELDLNAPNRSINDLLESIDNNDITKTFNVMAIKHPEFLQLLGITDLSGLEYIVKHEECKIVEYNYNNIKTLGNNLKIFKKNAVEEIWLQYNKIEDIGDSLDHLIGSNKLRSLYIKGNPLSQASLAKLKELQKLSPINLTIDIFNIGSDDSIGSSDDEKEE